VRTAVVGESHPRDADCGIEGKSTDADKKLESRAKNNFCATGTPTYTTFFMFQKLQNAISAPGFSMGTNRSGAQNLVVTNPAGVTVGEAHW